MLSLPPCLEEDQPVMVKTTSRFCHESLPRIPYVLDSLVDESVARYGAGPRDGESL